MDKQLKQKWLTALHSGEYKQARYALETRDGEIPEGNCCLGVLCRVADLEAFVSESNLYRTQFKGCTIGGLGKPLLESWGLDLDHQMRLQNMNDNENLSFLQIADYIEANL